LGTNYYLQRRDPKTGRCKDLHICKCSYGWSPSMRGYNQKKNTWHEINIMSWADWKWFLRKETSDVIGGMIFNEYDELIPYFDFIEMIERWKTIPGYGGSEDRPKKNHAKEALAGNFSSGYIDEHAKSCWIDPEGYSFCDQEFS